MATPMEELREALEDAAFAREHQPGLKLDDLLRIETAARAVLAAHDGDWEYGVSTEAETSSSFITDEAGARRDLLWMRDIYPAALLVRRRPAGPWEVCDAD